MTILWENDNFVVVEKMGFYVPYKKSSNKRVGCGQYFNTLQDAKEATKTQFLFI